MKAVMVMFDSLNRQFLSPYEDGITTTPNFRRLAEKAVTYQRSFAGSLPCMPARREIHTGRYNFLHRCWGPIEPFDDSMPEILKTNGVYTHLVSDHAHYWEDGGATYHTRYNSWEASRGQEGDSWKGSVTGPSIPEDAIGRKKHSWRQEFVNREHMHSLEDSPMHRTFSAGMGFLAENHQADDWFLQIETFEPHEPYFFPDGIPAGFGDGYTGPHFDWPEYCPSERYTTDQVAHVRNLYAAMVSRCDEYLGKVLDFFDEHGLWDDTMLIVNTDHGFLLGEHGWFGKNRMPTYTEIANTPFFVWDPRDPGRCGADDRLVQTIDIAPTLLDYFRLPPPPDMQGRPLSVLADPEASIHEEVLFGLHGGHLNVCDGRYLYMRAPVDPSDRELYNYTLMPTHIYNLFTPEELQDMELIEPLAFTKECKVLKIRALKPSHNTYQHTLGDFLFDLESDPGQEENIAGAQAGIVAQMQKRLVSLLAASDSPAETYARYGLDRP